MKIIKIRSIEEANKLTPPPIPDSFFDQGRELQRHAAAGMSRHSTLRGIYELIDKVGELIDPYTVCSSGCSACCHISVGITELEASYIEHNTGKRMRVGVRSSAEAIEGPCPFLSDDRRCTIYKFRPFACRVFAAFDNPAYCAEMDTSHVTYGPQSNAIFKGSAQWIKSLNRTGAIADIRAFFK